MIRRLSIVGLLIVLGLCGCFNTNEPTPKRLGYFRIALPERNYKTYTAECPFTFEYPQYATVLRDSGGGHNSCWLNIVFPQFRCNIYMSYLPVDTDVRAIIAECRKYVVEHEVKASGINERDVENPKDKIYGTIYDIEGNAASNMQFYLTDSTRNFIRGSLYFFAVPNKDSLEPVVNFVKEDINHLIASFRWRK